MTQPTTPEATTRKCPHCWSEIAKQASRCAYCTEVVDPMEVGATA